ncbi:LD-carboxypeptidase [Ruminococcaceae bacterium OttesenSCG-928-O06]|nr:LD-carboxypeptidase [Ruminococcaceae bacterium OttesenSCG-928-O06]
MKPLIKPPRLVRGDTIATVSLSWGGAGDEDILWRYHQGKRRLEEVFGLHVVEMPHTLAGSEYVYHHPEKRAQDLMQAFSDPSIKGILSCIGGEDSLRITPWLDYDVICRNPKLFCGYSDTTVTHFQCFKAGLSSLYGPSLLSDFAENVALPAYTEQWVQWQWFSPDAPGAVPTSPTYTGQRQEWLKENAGTARTFLPGGTYILVQGSGSVQGPLIGGCLEALDFLKGTELFPAKEEFEGAILFLETSEEKPPPWFVTFFLRSLAAMGILQRLAGILFAKPQQEVYQQEYHAAIVQVLAEANRADMPVLGNASFGHNEPKFSLPMGALAAIHCGEPRFELLESGVL